MKGGGAEEVLSLKLVRLVIQVDLLPFRLSSKQSSITMLHLRFMNPWDSSARNDSSDSTSMARMHFGLHSPSCLHRQRLPSMVCVDMPYLPPTGPSQFHHTLTMKTKMTLWFLLANPFQLRCRALQYLILPSLRFPSLQVCDLLILLATPFDHISDCTL